MSPLPSELKRRKVIRVAGLYVLASWVLLQVADLAFDNWGIPSEAMRFVWIGAIVGFPIALFLGWRFDIAGGRIVRTPERHDEAAIPLQRADRLILVFVAVVVLMIGVGLIFEISRTHSLPTDPEQTTHIDPKSIAVLPFADMSPDGDQAYFADGISEELLNLLAKYQGLRVISRSSAFALRDAALSIPELAEKLNVAHVLEGSVRKAANRVRVTAQLIDARSDSHLWSETYDRDLDDVFAIQDEISAQVVRELKVRLLDRAPASGATSPAAYEMYLQGLSKFADRRQDAVVQAIESFDQVIAVDPDYAPAYANKAVALVWSNLDTPTRHERMSTAVERALALDPENSLALAALGRLQLEQNQRARAQETLEQAIAINPNNAMAHRWLALTYNATDPARYLALAREAYLVDPLDRTILVHISLALESLGRTSEAIDAAGERRRLDPSNAWPYGRAGDIYFVSGRLDLALKSYYRAYRTERESWTIASLPWLFIEMQEFELAEVWNRELNIRDPEDWTAIRQQVVLAYERGDEAIAIQLISDAAKKRRDRDLDWDVGQVHIRITGDFDGARAAFDRLLRDPEQEVPDVGEGWIPYIDYALALQRTGSPELAEELIADILERIEALRAAGAVWAPFGSLDAYLAQLHAMRGDTEQAMAALRAAVLLGDLRCVVCLRRWPYYDSLRSEPEFEALIAEQEAKMAATRQRLADENMMLSPEEVLALEEFPFDPFLIE